MHLLCTYVSEEGGNGEGADSKALSLLSYTLRFVPMHLCTCVSEEGGDGESVGSEALSLL